MSALNNNMVKRISHWFYLYLGVMILSSILSVLFVVVEIQAILSPPVQITALGTNVPPALCPGDRLETSIKSQIRKAPVILLIVESIYSTDLGQTVVFDDLPQMAVFSAPQVVLRTWSTTVPDLPPGKYEWRVGVQAWHLSADAFSVPFSVREDCGLSP